VHKVFKDETRFRLVELLQENGHLSYSDIQRLLAIKNTGKLNYHLKVLDDLIQKDFETGMYSLSEKGKVAAQFVTRFEVASHGPPTGVVVIGVLMIIGGFGTAIGAAPSLASCFVGGGTCQGATLFDLLFTFLVLVIYGFASAGSGVGLLIGRRWARRGGHLRLHRDGFRLLWRDYCDHTVDGRKQPSDIRPGPDNPLGSSCDSSAGDFHLLSHEAPNQELLRP